jgi:predicted small lipoprotein YifL
MLAPVAIAVLAAAAACGSSGNPSATPSTQLSGTQTPTSTQAQEFASNRYGFRVTLTKAWSEADATADWDGKELQGIGSPLFANFYAVGGRVLVAGAAPVPAGTQLAAWRAAMVRAAPSACSDSPSAENMTLGGEPALAWTATCSDGYHVIKLAALHGTRGYMVFLPSQAANVDAANRRTFESIRQSFRFTG